MNLAILYGTGHLAEYIRQNIPPHVSGVDVRVNSSAGNVQYGGRKLIELDNLDSNRIMEIFKERNITEVMFCGRPSFNTFHFKDGIFDSVPGFNPSATWIFDTIEKHILGPAGV